MSPPYFETPPPATVKFVYKNIMVVNKFPDHPADFSHQVEPGILHLGFFEFDFR